MPRQASKAIEIIKGTINTEIDRLYWVSDNQAPQKMDNVVYFNIDTVRHS